MDLGKKKKLAKRTLGIGGNRIIFLESRIEEIKEAITKQDIRDLLKSGAIVIRDVKGRQAVRGKKSRSIGNVRKKVKRKKRGYIILTRKLRKYLKSLKESKKIKKEEVADLRKKVRNREFKSMAQIKENIGGIKK